MLPALSQATSVGWLNVEPGTPVAGLAPLAAAAAAAATATATAAAAGRAGRLRAAAPPITSGLRPSTSATRPSVSNFTTWLAPTSMVQTLSCGSTRRPKAALKP